MGTNQSNEDDGMSVLKNCTDDQLVHFFKTNKVEISEAIDNPYPFLYSLKDHDIITEDILEETKYKQKPWDLSEKVYSILSQVEKSGISIISQVMTLLWKDSNLNHYPKLNRIYSNFYKGAGSTTETVLPDVSFKTGSPDVTSSGASSITEAGFSDVSSEAESPEVSSSGAGSTTETAFQDVSYMAKTPDVSSPGAGSTTEIAFSEIFLMTASPDVSSSGDWTMKMVGKKTNKKSKKALEDFSSNELDVKCGSSNGILYKDKLARGSQEKCIRTSDGKLLSVIEFEAHGGRSRSKCWKRSISCNGVTLSELILQGHIPNPPNVRGRSSSAQTQKVPVQEIAVGKGSSHISYGSQRIGSLAASSSRPSTPSAATKKDTDSLASNELPVVCGSSTGILHKHRFASGSHGKCIRTVNKWCTPEEFANLNDCKDFTSWKEKILCDNLSLDVLIEKGYLKPHAEGCSCDICTDESKLQNENDDVCSVCKDGGDLICCDECPRAFHTNCHIPEIPSPPSSSVKWICTMCNLERQRKLEKEKPVYLESEVLCTDMKPPRRLKCEYLLLKLYNQDESVVFTRDPRETIPNYENSIAKPMWLNKIKYNLADGKYNTSGGFIRDVRQVFQNCSEFNKNNEFGQMGRKLHEDFEKTFYEVFDIRPQGH